GKYYGGLKNTAEPGQRQRLVEPPAEVERQVVLRDANVSDPRLYRTYLAVAAAKSPKEAAALDVLSTMLGDGPTSKLYQDLVIDKKIATSVSAWFDGDNLDSGTFGIYSAPLPGISMAELGAGIDTAVAEAKAGAFSDEDL